MFIAHLIEAVTIISLVGWVLFAILTLFSFLSLLFRRGPIKALRFLVSPSILITALLLFLFSLLSRAMVFVEPQNIDAVPSVFSAHGIRP